MPMPGEQGIRAHDGFELLEHAAPQALRLGAQPNALFVGEPGTARTELLSKDAILGLEIVDHLTLLVVDPAGQGDEEKPQRVRNRNHRAQPIKDLDRISGQYTIGLTARWACRRHSRWVKPSSNGTTLAFSVATGSGT
jgi:hypothetical protein